MRWDAATIGAIGINLFTVVEGLGLFLQIREIWKQRSGKSVSVGMTLFFVVMFASCIVYGATYHRPPIVFNGLVLGIGFLVVAIELAIFKGYRGWEKIFGLVLLGPLGMMLLSSHRDWWYFAFSVGSAGALMLQPWEIWKNRSAGAVDVRLLVLFLASNSFWVVYGYAIHDWVLMSLCPVYVVVLLVAIWLWWIYRPSKTRLKLPVATQ